MKDQEEKTSNKIFKIILLKMVKIIYKISWSKKKKKLYTFYNSKRLFHLTVSIILQTLQSKMDFLHEPELDAIQISCTAATASGDDWVSVMCQALGWAGGRLIKEVLPSSLRSSHPTNKQDLEINKLLKRKKK